MEEQPVAAMAVPIQDPKANGSDGTLPNEYRLDDLKLVWSDGRALERDGGARPGLLAAYPSVARVLSGYRAVSVGLALSDAACIVGALLLSYYLRYHGTRSMPLNELAIVAVAPLVWVGVFRAFGLYAPQHLAPPEEFRRAIGATSLGIVLVTMASYWSMASVSRAWVGLTWPLALLMILVARWRWRAYQERLKAAGRLTFRTLIVGATAEAARFAQILKAPASGFAPLGYVGTSEPSAPANSLPVVGNLTDLRRLIREHAADCLFVASTSISADDMSKVVQAARQEGVEVRVSANLSQTLTSRLALQSVGGAITLSLRPVHLTGTQVALKRGFDLVVASIALLVSLPLWAVIGAAIRLTSPGPALFRQERVTKGGRVFWMRKFRTMRTDVERPLDTSAPFFKLQSDPRLTRVGGIIRRLSLDELPQLLNVLKGEMSIVGPRPLPADQVAANLELLSPRQEVLAGITGWWQINGRSAVTPEEAVRLDAFYIENWSLTLDLYIVLKTFAAVLGRRGAC